MRQKAVGKYDSLLYKARVIRRQNAQSLKKSAGGLWKRYLIAPLSETVQGGSFHRYNFLNRRLRTPDKPMEAAFLAANVVQCRC